MRPEPDKATIARAYAQWAPIYDFVFGAVFRQGRRDSISAAERVGGDILDVGVGTGIAFPQYGVANRVFGVDLSEPMLKKAQERGGKLSNVVGVAVMDAENLGFADESFDVVIAQYVVTAVPHPEAALDEFARVLRPGGEIVLLSRLSEEAGLRNTVERLLTPVTNRLGWRLDFPWERYARWLDRQPMLRVVERRAMPPFGHFSLIRFGKAGHGAPSQQLASAGAVR